MTAPPVRPPVDLVERLRESAFDVRIGKIYHALSMEAADEIERLREENDRLATALRCIAGEQQPVDNLLSDKELARAVLHGPYT